VRREQSACTISIAEQSELSLAHPCTQEERHAPGIVRDGNRKLEDEYLNGRGDRSIKELMKLVLFHHSSSGMRVVHHLFTDDS
jgi:hypothetical protein